MEWVAADVHACLLNTRSYIHSINNRIVNSMWRKGTCLFKWSVLCSLLLYILLIQYLKRCPFNSGGTSARGASYQARDFNELIRHCNQASTERLQRAIVIFYPDNQEKKYLFELRWLYLSWIEMINAGEPAYWRTDLVIFSGHFTSNLQKLGCLFDQIRRTKDEKPQCRVFPYCRVAARNQSDHDSLPTDYRRRSELLYSRLQNYRYVDSINIIFEGYSVFQMYDYILRTDIDVFLTKQFALSIPITNITLLTGHGGYSVDFNDHRLRRVARDLSWQHANLSNIGSTWYGPPAIAHRIANLSLEAMVYLDQYEFTTAERERKLGVLQWPDWHYGVLTMYGNHLAINHLVIDEQLDIQIAHRLLDQRTVSFDDRGLDQHRPLHLHAWHGHHPFSKFDFRNGTYDEIDTDSFLNNTSAGAYAMRIALQSKRMTLAELAGRLISTQAKHSK